jgi:hypothetical protein
MNWSQPLILYHGTSREAAMAILTGGPDLGKADPNADFGPGFYCTECPEQASKFATQLHSKNPAMLEFSVCREDLIPLSCLHFSRTTEHFWSFVDRFRENYLEDHGRVGTNANFDIVLGPVARNHRYRTVYEQMDQISFHTQQAITTLLVNRPRIHNMMAKCDTCLRATRKPC